MHQYGYLMQNYDRHPPFSSFLPGVAGLLGVPMWVFYVNRGQAIASFGVVNKDSAMLEFQPANKAYRLTPTFGFRTFLKLTVGGNTYSYEPFAPWSVGDVTRTMETGMNNLTLEERHQEWGLTIKVQYYTLTNLPVAGLVRQVRLHNHSQYSMDIEWLDGLPQVVPYGTDNGALKHISRTIEAWMQVEDHTTKIPFYRLRASAEDVAEVREIIAGHFAMATLFEGDHVQSLPVIVDSDIIFAWDTSMRHPTNFWNQSLTTLLEKEQICVGKMPSAFFGCRVQLHPGQDVMLSGVYGHTDHKSALKKYTDKLRQATFLNNQLESAKSVAEELTAKINTRSREPLFDGYASQTFLDNVLRGGWPLPLPGGHIYHVYSRKHGDLERDYNDFVIAAEYYSQGNGNFRDVAQNRRMDAWFEPRVGDFNLRLFTSLIQADGYNPLVIQGMHFVLDDQAVNTLLEHTSKPEVLREFLVEPFTPGSLLKSLENLSIPLDISPHDFVLQAIALAESQIQASYGEGFWVDHWTYLLDLVESYAAVFPEQLPSTLFECMIPMYNSPAVVRPRKDRYILTEKGPRQLNAVAHIPEKEELLATRGYWVRDKYGKGEVFTMRIVEKLLLLALLKFGTRDLWGMGVEMEAGKPGWYDALNGLPGVFGSSMPETYELLRLLYFLRDQLTLVNEEISLPEEADDLLVDTLRAMSLPVEDDFARWEALNAARERYREQTMFGVSGKVVSRSSAEWCTILKDWIEDVERGIARAAQFSPDVPVTYFSWDVSDFVVQHDDNGKPRLDQNGRQYIWPTVMQPRALPLFLEGAVRAMKVSGRNETLLLHQNVLKSPLWDAALGMFKVNASLESQPHDIGRARAFPPGWLENESIWLHMHYKYLLGLLQKGLFDAFFNLARSGLIPFRDPLQYGRSPLENSSFLVSSVHPDSSLHGRGFVARLSGATAEFIHMWGLMTAGPRPFVLTDEGLVLQLRPALPGWLFTEDGRFEYSFLGHTRVVLHNPTREDLYPGIPVRMKLRSKTGNTVDVSGPDLLPPYAGEVRRGHYQQIEIFFAGEIL